MKKYKSIFDIDNVLFTRALQKNAIVMYMFQLYTGRLNLLVMSVITKLLKCKIV